MFIIKLRHKEPISLGIIRKQYCNDTIIVHTIGVIHIMENYYIERVLSFEALYESMNKCKCNVQWKTSVSHYVLNGIEETLKLEEQLKNGTYIPKPPKKFMLTSPKKREAVSIAFRDRVYQRSLNDNVIYPIMTHSFIYDNFACQKGKGTDKARDRLHEFMRKFYRHNNINGYVLQCDIKGYYPNMNHDVAENIFKKVLPTEIYKLAERILREQYKGDIGYNPGSQLIQIAGISVLNGLDHYIKEQLRVKYYIRYMDDFILIHEDKDFLCKCKKEIEKYLLNLDFTLNEKKTNIYELRRGIKFLGFQHRITPTGKIIMTINPKNVKMERKKLRRMVNKVKKGYMTKEKADECYKAWRNHASKGNSYKLLCRMDKFYKELYNHEI